MLIGVFKSNQKLLGVIVILLITLMWLPGFFIDSHIDPSNLLSTNYRWLDIIISILLISFQSIYLNKIVNDYKLVKDNSHLTSLMLLLFNSCGLLVLNLNQVVIANSFIIVVFHQLLRAYNVKNGYALWFNVGFLVSIASLIYLPNVVYLLLVLVVLIYTTTPKWRDFVVILLGFSTPIIYLVTYKFVFENIELLSLNDYFKALFEVKLDDLSIFQKIFFIDLIIISLLAFMTLSSILGKNVVRVRKMLVVVVLMLIMGGGTLFLNQVDYLATFLTMSIPLSIIIANFFQNIKKSWLAELLFVTLIGGLILSYFS